MSVQQFNMLHLVFRIILQVTLFGHNSGYVLDVYEFPMVTVDTTLENLETPGISFHVSIPGPGNCWKTGVFKNLESPGKRPSF